MSVCISISPKYEKVALTNELLSNLVDSVSGLSRDGEVLIWKNHENRDIQFNIGPNELWCDGIHSDEDYQLIKRIADHLDFKVSADGEPVVTDESADQGFSLLGIMGSMIVGFASIVVVLFSILTVPFRLILALRKDKG
jgi:hypothetical protein